MESAANVLADLRKTRARRHRAAISRSEIMYRTYLGAFLAFYLFAFISGRYAARHGDAALVSAVARHGVAVGGVFVSLVLVGAIRSGLRGGPTAPSLADSYVLMLAPIDRSLVFGDLAGRLTRWSVGAAAAAGALGGAIAWTSMRGNLAAWVSAGALAAVSVTAAACGIAMLVSGRRASQGRARAATVLLVATSTLELARVIHVSPGSLVARVALWPLRFEPWSVAVLVLVALAFSSGYRALGGTPLESAVRRAGLGSSLRFAITMRDWREVVLIRRHLAGEVPRLEPWLRLPVKRWHRVPVWKRHWHGALRWSAARVARLACIGAASGVASVVFWRGRTLAIGVPLLALFLGALDVTEAIGQDLDRPDIHELAPRNGLTLLLRAMSGPFAVMLLVTLIGSGSAFVFAPSVLTFQVGLLTAPLAALGCVTAATYSIAREPAPLIRDQDVAGAATGGLSVITRQLQRPALTGVGLLPLILPRLLRSKTPAHPLALAVSGAVLASLFLSGSLVWFRFGPQIIAFVMRVRVRIRRSLGRRA